MTAEPTVIASFFRVTNILGSGSFSKVFEAVDTRTNAHVAVKLEAANATHPQLVYEYNVLNELKNAHGIPRVYWFSEEDSQNVLIMQKLGANLEQLRLKHGGRLPLPVVADIARQALERLEACHAKAFVHRDVKPENFAFGTKTRRHLLYLIDFGLCKRLLDKRGVHIHQRSGKHLIGTPRYASLNTHAGLEQSRRDDVEALAYMLVFLAKGSLPWQGITTPEDDKTYQTIARVKRDTPLEVLCADLPKAFRAMITYARQLEFTAMPDYTLLYSWWLEVEGPSPAPSSTS